MTPREEKLEKALSQILRMSHVPLNDRESPGSRMWRQDVACIAMQALGMEPAIAMSQPQIDWNSPASIVRAAFPNVYVSGSGAICYRNAAGQRYWIADSWDEALEDPVCINFIRQNKPEGV